MEHYSIPDETTKLLWNGILNNPLHTSTPSDLREAAKHVQYVGTNFPWIPNNWKFAESISALKGFESSMLNVLLKRKYGVEYQKVVINTDHAQLFIMSPLLPLVDPLGRKIRVAPSNDFHEVFGPDINLHNYRLTSPCTNIYRTRDNLYYHVHGSLNHTITQEALGVTDEEELGPWDLGVKAYQSQVEKYAAEDLDILMNDTHRQAGSICYTKEDYAKTAHGKANSHVGLYEIHHIANPVQAPVWWKPIEGKADASRPLFGLKVIDLTRILASPVITKELAEMGASILRVTAPHVTDVPFINIDVGWGKWNAHLDLRKEEDRAKLRELIEDADVVVDGYRPHIMAKYGFGKDDILGFFNDKTRGIIYVHENSYGWNGPWAYRSGWQQISDANVGIAYEFGRAMGLEEPVVPVFPNTDVCTGVAGATAILEALIARSESGGSFVIDVALNYYTQWLVRSCGTYPSEVWDTLWSKYGRFVFRHHDSMAVTIPAFMTMLTKANTPINNPDFYEIRPNKAIGLPVRTVRPISTFPEGLVQLKYNVGSRPNGKDAARWPDDLLTEIIA